MLSNYPSCTHCSLFARVRADKGAAGIWNYIRKSPIGQEMEWEEDEEEEEERQEVAPRAQQKKRRKARGDGGRAGWSRVSEDGGVQGAWWLGHLWWADVSSLLSLPCCGLLAKQDRWPARTSGEGHAVLTPLSMSCCACCADEVASEDDLEKAMERQVAAALGKERQYVSEEQVRQVVHLVWHAVQLLGAAVHGAAFAAA